MNDSADPRIQLERMINGYRQSTLLYAAVKLGIADQVGENSLTSSELATRLSVPEPGLRRILRGLAAAGILNERSDHTYALTATGRLLCSNAPGALRELAILSGEDYATVWGALADGVRTGKTAYGLVHGASPWKRREALPELNDAFNRWLSAKTAEVAGVIAGQVDFSRFRVLADIAGGEGALLAALLNANPGTRGILFEQDHVTGAACLRDERIQVVTGDMFKEINVNADAYLLKSVLHDWDDEACGQILRNCHRAMRHDNSLLIIERLMPAMAADDPAAVMLDIHMMAVTGGRERTGEELLALLNSNGFQLRRTTATSTGFSVLEATPV